MCHKSQSGLMVYVRFEDNDASMMIVLFMLLMMMMLMLLMIRTLEKGVLRDNASLNEGCDVRHVRNRHAL